VAESDLQPEVRKFISDHVHSIEQLEVLLLLRASPDRTWSAADVNAELRTSLASAQVRLRELERDRLLIADGASAGYRYHPADAEQRRVIDLVAEAYRERRVTVTTLVFSKPQDAIRDLADAFILGRGKGDG
jgi:hypothetical protein